MGELQPQYLPTLHFYDVCLVEVVWVVVRVFWRGDVTYGFQDELKVIFFTTHLHCHSLLQGKVGSALAARVRIQWSSREHKLSSQRHTGRSSIWKQMETAQCHHWHRHSGNLGLHQMQHRDGQVLEAEEDNLDN